MARMRFSRSRAVIQTRKHIIPQGVAAIALGAISVIPIATAVETPIPLTTFHHVQIGSVIKAVYIEMWIRGDDETAASSNVQVSFEKLEGSMTAMIFADGATLNAYDNKSNIFYVTQGLTSAGTANSGIPFLRGWFKVPKGFQRMSNGDRLVLNVIGLNHDLEICGLFIYKEYQ